MVFILESHEKQTDIVKLRKDLITVATSLNKNNIDAFSINCTH